MPDIQAQTADGVIHSFPDGTPDDVVDKVIKDYTTKAGASTTPAAKPGAFQTMRGGPVQNVNTVGSRPITYPSAGAAVSGAKARAKLPQFPSQLEGAMDSANADLPAVGSVLGGVGGLPGSSIGTGLGRILQPYAKGGSATGEDVKAGAEDAAIQYGLGKAIETVAPTAMRVIGKGPQIARDVANKYVGSTLADAIMPEAPEPVDELEQAIKEGRAKKLSTTVPKPKTPPTIDKDTAARISRPEPGPILSRTPAWKTATANMPPPPDIAAATPTTATPAVTPAATPVATAAPAAPAPTSLDAAIEARTAARAANAAKVAESSKLDEAIAANRPTDTEQTLTRLVKKRIWTPDDFRDAVNALGRDGLRRPSEGQSAYQARVMGMIRSSRAAVGMADSGSGIVRPPAP